VDEEVEEIRRALQEIRLFSDVLSADQLDQLARECRPFLFRAGSTLMRQGDFGESMFCIVEGAVSITFVGPAMRQNEIRQIGAGSVVGEIELLTGERRVATVTAVTNVRALEITKSALESVLANAPELIESFGAILAIRQDLLDHIVAQQSGTLASRIVNRLRRLLAR
jgi:CRP-like cAMP-binding protein